MLDGLFMLLGLSVVMALASFLAGALPLSMSLSQTQLRLISTIGMGVLVGTSLIVIIPEGIETVYSARLEGHTHDKRLQLVPEKSLDMRWMQGVRGDEVIQPLHARESPDTDVINALPGPVIPSSLPEIATETSDSETIDIDHRPLPDHPDKEFTTTGSADHSEPSQPTFYIGLSLILGFILMFLIDKLPRHASETLQPSPPTRHISLNNLSQGLHESPTANGEEDTESFLHSITPSPKQTRSLATTTGLVIHAAADGIAMGASSTAPDAKLGFIIFFAIMLHKAPAAFGLTSVLLKQGLSKRAARGHLIIFSLAAPFGALTTWLLIHLLGGGGAAAADSESGKWWTGMLLLFSAGTFLYVAMHAMQEDGAGHDHLTTNGYVDGVPSAQRKQHRPQMRDTFAAVGGMLLPLLTQIGHHH